MSDFGPQTQQRRATINLTATARVAGTGHCQSFEQRKAASSTWWPMSVCSQWPLVLLASHARLSSIWTELDPKQNVTKLYTAFIAERWCPQARRNQDKVIQNAAVTNTQTRTHSAAYIAEDIGTVTVARSKCLRKVYVYRCVRHAGIY